MRAARYAARFDLELEPRTAELLQGADLGTVSSDRVEAELRKIAGEDSAPRALELIPEWGLLELPGDAVELAERLRELLPGRRPGWDSPTLPRRSSRRSATATPLRP